MSEREKSIQKKGSRHAIKICVYLLYHDKGTIRDFTGKSNYNSRNYYYNAADDLCKSETIRIISKKPKTYEINYSKFPFLKDELMQSFFRAKKDILMGILAGKTYTFLDWWDIMLEVGTFFPKMQALKLVLKYPGIIKNVFLLKRKL